MLSPPPPNLDAQFSQHYHYVKNCLSVWGVAGMCYRNCVEVRGSLWRSFFFHRVGPRDLTQVVWLLGVVASTLDPCAAWLPQSHFWRDSLFSSSCHFCFCLKLKNQLSVLTWVISGLFVLCCRSDSVCVVCLESGICDESSFTVSVQDDFDYVGSFVVLFNFFRPFCANIRYLERYTLNCRL